MSKLFSPKIPDIDDPVSLPDEEVEERARRRRVASLRTRRGRESTNLAPSSTGTGTEFSRTLLG